MDDVVRHPVATGDLAEAWVIYHLCSHRIVTYPVAANHLPYDLICDLGDGRALLRVQVKGCGSLHPNGVLKWNTRRNTRDWKPAGSLAYMDYTSGDFDVLALVDLTRSFPRVAYLPGSYFFENPRHQISLTPHELDLLTEPSLQALLGNASLVATYRGSTPRRRRDDK